MNIVYVYILCSVVWYEVRYVYYEVCLIKNAKYLFFLYSWSKFCDSYLYGKLLFLAFFFIHQKQLITSIQSYSVSLVDRVLATPDNIRLHPVQCSRSFVDRYEREQDTFLDKIITMDESPVSYHTLETKEQSKKWVKKRSPGPIKCKTQASRVKQMLLSFHNREDLIYTNMVPRGNHCQRRIHYQCPQSVFEEDDAEETTKRGRVYPPLGQCPYPHRAHCQELPGHQREDRDDGPPPPTSSTRMTTPGATPSGWRGTKSVFMLLVLMLKNLYKMFFL